MSCYYCQSDTEEKLVTVNYRWAGELYIIQDVPAQVCVMCRQKFFHATVSRQMEKIAREGLNKIATISVPVLEFKKAV